MNVVVYRSKRKPDTYLYVEQTTEISDLPELLMQSFTEPEAFLEFELHESRRLQQADPVRVMASVREQGFYLQLPPAKQDDVLAD